MHLSNEHGRGSRAVPQSQVAENNPIHGVPPQQFVQVPRVHDKIRRPRKLRDHKIDARVMCYNCIIKIKINLVALFYN